MNVWKRNIHVNHRDSRILEQVRTQRSSPAIRSCTCIKLGNRFEKEEAAISWPVVPSSKNNGSYNSHHAISYDLLQPYLLDFFTNLPVSEVLWAWVWSFLNVINLQRTHGEYYTTYRNLPCFSWCFTKQFQSHSWSVLMFCGWLANLFPLCTALWVRNEQHTQDSSVFLVSKLMFSSKRHLESRTALLSTVQNDYVIWIWETDTVFGSGMKEMRAKNSQFFSQAE